jgi:hypothetical protein
MVIVHSDNFLLIFVLPTVIAYLAMTVRVMHYLETHHEEAWRQLGSPAGLPCSIKLSRAVSGYILYQRKYRALNDPKLDRLVWISRGLGWWSAAGMLMHIFGLAPHI